MKLGESRKLTGRRACLNPRMFLEPQGYLAQPVILRLHLIAVIKVAGVGAPIIQKESQWRLSLHKKICHTLTDEMDKGS